MRLAVRAHSEGVLLPVKALPGSRKNEFRGEHDGRLKVGVTAIAENGKANKAITVFWPTNWDFLEVQSFCNPERRVPSKRFL